MLRTILDLCGGSGAWSKPYRDAGYLVHTVDLPRDVRLLKWDQTPIHGILAAPPCTAFSYARNRHPASKGQIREALSIVDACLRAVTVYKPSWWALENPRALLRKYLGPARLEFYQWQYGDAGHKPTCIWGEFTVPIKRPTARSKPSTWRTSNANALPSDAITPPGFARAFFEANP